MELNLDVYRVKAGNLVDHLRQPSARHTPRWVPADYEDLIIDMGWAFEEVMEELEIALLLSYMLCIMEGEDK